MMSNGAARGDAVSALQQAADFFGKPRGHAAPVPRPACHGVRATLRRRTTSTTEPSPIASARCTAALTGTR